MAISETSLVDGALMAIDEINENGGILGKRLKPIIIDGASDPERFAREAENLIVKQGVRAVFGGWTSASRKTMAPIFEKYNNLLWYPVQHEGLEQSPNIIYTGAVPNQQILPAVDWACAQFGKKVFLVGSDYVFPRTANAIITDRVQELGGSIVGEEYRKLGGRDFKEIIKKIQETQPDVIFNTINGDSNIEFFEILRRAGIHSKDVPTVSFSISEEEIQDMKLESVVGDYSVWNYFQSIDSRANKSFVHNFQKKYGDDRVVSDPIAAAYTSVYLFAKAVESAGADDSKSVRDALAHISFESPEGKVRIDKKTQHLKRTVRIGKIEIDGQFEVVWESEEQISPFIYPTCRTEKEWNAFLNDLYVGWGKRWQK
jgi:urea transport system substrate-binding protein